MKTTVAANEVVRLADLEPVNPEKVEVRDVLSTDGGAVAMLTFKSGQKLAEHAAPGEVLIVALAGHLHFTVDGRDLHLAAGDALRMAKGTLHSVGADSDSRVLLIKLN